MVGALVCSKSHSALDFPPHPLISHARCLPYALLAFDWGWPANFKGTPCHAALQVLSLTLQKVWPESHREVGEDRRRGRGPDRRCHAKLQTCSMTSARSLILGLSLDETKRLLA